MINSKVLYVLLTLIVLGCQRENQIEQTITSITTDIDLDDDRTYIINTNINHITGSINLGGNTILKIENAILNFDLNEDLQYGIYLEDHAKIIINNATLKSENKMWEFELRGKANIEITNSFLRNHSAVKLFEHCVLNGTNTLIEELRMDNQSNATINDCEIYPNMQFFFSPEMVLEFPESYAKINYTIDNTNQGGWKLNMLNSIAQGWQVDVKPTTTLSIKNSTDVSLALWSNGTINDSISIVNPENYLSNFSITEFGSNVTIINTEVYFINLYLKGNDKLIVTGESTNNGYNTKFLEIVLNDNAELTVYDSHIFGQLFHVNDNTKVSIYNCLIGSDDPTDPIHSEFGVKDNSRGFAFDCDISNTDIVIEGTSILEFTNCIYSSERVFISDMGELIVN